MDYKRLREKEEIVKKFMHEAPSLEEYLEETLSRIMCEIEDVEDIKYKISQLEKEIAKEKEKTAKKSSLLGFIENRVFKNMFQAIEVFTCFLMSVSCLVAIYKLIKK